MIENKDIIFYTAPHKIQVRCYCKGNMYDVYINSKNICIVNEEDLKKLKNILTNGK